MPGDNIPPDPYMDAHTVGAEEAARLLGMMRTDQAGVERFGGRETIGRDTFPIDGKVDIRSWQGGAEAIVVDSKKNPEGYDPVRNRFQEQLAQQADTDERSVLGTIYDTVRTTMRYDLDGVEELNKRLGVAEKTKTNKIGLEVYMDAGIGVCRHMALAESWLGGEAVESGLLPQGTKVTAEVNQHAERGAHEWARATLPDGSIYILDAAQGFFGTLQEAATRAQWDYFRPEEREAYLKEKGQSQKPEQLPLGDTVTITPEKQQGLEWFNNALTDLSRAEKELAEQGRPLPPATPPSSMYHATVHVLNKGTTLLGDVMARLDVDVGQAMDGLADSLADQIRRSYGKDIERVYPPGMIAGTDAQKQWLQRVTNELRQLQPTEKAQSDQWIHTGLAAQRKIAQLLQQQFAKYGGTQAG